MDIWWKLVVVVLAFDAVASCIAAFLISMRITSLVNRIATLERFVSHLP